MTNHLLADLIDIPEAVHKSDFVISLASGVTDPERTLAEYVVTPQLVECFNAALSLITSATTDAKSKGAYLHGSFGSGKSHFMAVLHLLLQGNPAALGIPELGQVIAHHQPQLTGKRFMLVPYHFIGMESMEQVVLGGYVEHVRKLHPDASLPAVYLADDLLQNAIEMRSKLTDDAFFQMLNAGDAVADDAWGDLGGAWDAARFDDAIEAGPDSDLREQLVSALMRNVFSGMSTLMNDVGEGFVPLDKGLEAISRHAHGLGYDAVVLFLDELILWLASRMGDHNFVTREGSKVAKLVEGDASERPAPIVSFIARQRDLRELVGEHVPGAEQMNFGDILRFWEGRFDLVTLEDRNLIAIAEKRILRPRNDAARQEIDDAFSVALSSVDQQGNRDTLLTDQTGIDAFRRVYPFNPALVEALVALSAALQRERTALKVMVQLLSRQRETLHVGELIPLGDLYDVIASGDDPMTAGMREPFEHAKRLWRAKFEPMLVRNHHDDATTPAFNADARLVKSLLLAALVPEVPALRNLTVSRLVALNHGTIRTFIPGTERQVALDRLRMWSAEIGELRVGDDDRDPSVSVQLSGVDITPILKAAGPEDNAGRRQLKIQALLAEAFELKGEQSMTPTIDVLWRGFVRRVDVVFANIRDDVAYPNDVLRAGGELKVVIDLPFDHEGFGPNDDRARVETFINEQPATPTICWIPSFFTEATRARLGDLVKIEHVLSGDRMNSYAGHLAPVDRQAARTQLENQASALREQIQRALRQAYAIEQPDAAIVSVTLEQRDQFTVLDRSITVQPPVAAGLRLGLEHLVDQVLSQRYSAHPDISGRVTDPELRTVLAEVRTALGKPNLRHENVDSSHRSVLARIAQPLKLGEMYPAHFVASTYWRDHFERYLASEAPVPLRVGDLRRWIDQPKTAGMPKKLSDLVIAVYLAQTNRLMIAAGRPLQPEIGNLDDAYELHQQQPPNEDVWRIAVSRAGEMFGITGISPMPSVTAVSELARRVADVVREERNDLPQLVAELNAACARLGIAEDNDRLETAKAAVSIVEELLQSPDKVADTLAGAYVPSSPAALGSSIKQTRAVSVALRGMNWVLLKNALALGGAFAGEAALIGDKLREAVARNQSVCDLVERLAAAERDATDLIGRAVAAATPPVVNDPPPPPPPPSGLTRVQAEARLSELSNQLRAGLHLEWTVTGDEG